MQHKLPIYFFLLLIFLQKNTFAQEVNLKISAYKSDKEYKFYATNPHPCPVQTQVVITYPFNITYTHKDYPIESYLYTIIPPNKQEYHFLTIQLVDSTIEKLTYKYHAHLGLPTEKIDSNFLYVLPYEIGKKSFVPQGYNGRFSHKKQYALDFKMREKTPIRAARDGLVIALKDDSDKGGRTVDFANLANYIAILHKDNTFALYYHLFKNGSKVKLGDKVTQGQIIGLSGNTGWSTAPHLHFVVKKVLQNTNPITIPTFFVGRKKKKIRVKAWNFYRARY